MEQIKNYFKGWGIARIIRIVLAGVLGILYYFNHENIFLFLGMIFALQALFNITCPGGSCSTNSKSDKGPVIKVKEYDPNN